MGFRYEGYVLIITALTQLASIGFAYSISSLFGKVEFQIVQGTASPLINALIFAMLPALGAIIYIRLRKYKRAKLAYAIAEAALVFILTSMILSLQNLNYLANLLLSSLSFVFTFIVIFRGEMISKTALSILVASEAGSFLGLVFTPPTLFLVLLFFAIYDLIAVYKGPLKRVIDQPGFGMLTLDLGKITMGLGDQIFYSMVPAAAYLAKGLPLSLLSMFVVDAGVFMTMILLRRVKVLPGLTIPLLLSLLLFLLTF